jgi:hypothetical protein
MVAATYDTSYDVPASVAALAGSYKGTQGHYSDPFSMTATIDADGKIALTGGCRFSGSAVPHGSTGVFDLTIKTVTGPCLGPGRSAKGILMRDEATGGFIGLAPFDAEISGDMLFIGATRQ